jgi:hypothetical protein
MPTEEGEAKGGEGEEGEEGGSSGPKPADAEEEEEQQKRKPCVKLLCLSKDQAGRGARSSATEAPIKGFGILQRHAYSFVDLREVVGYRLVRIRNPWGTGEWTGPWGDKVCEHVTLRVTLQPLASASALVGV